MCRRVGRKFKYLVVAFLISMRGNTVLIAGNCVNTEVWLEINRFVRFFDCMGGEVSLGSRVEYAEVLYRCQLGEKWLLLTSDKRL